MAGPMALAPVVPERPQVAQPYRSAFGAFLTNSRRSHLPVLIC